MVQTCLCAGSTLQRRINRQGTVVKHMQACLSARRDGESSFLHCGSPVNLGQGCLCVGSTLQRSYYS